MFDFKPLAISDVILIEPKVFADERGFFTETFHASIFQPQGINGFVQSNLSKSAKGVLRGLHYQLDPMSQGKLVSVMSGKIFDVAVDLRQGSPSFGQWVGAELSEDNHRMLWVPEGFAHGFLALQDDTRVLYQVTAEYAPKLDRNIRWDDSQLAIDWPLETLDAPPSLSPKDAAAPFFNAIDNNFQYAGVQGQGIKSDAAIS